MLVPDPGPEVLQAEQARQVLEALIPKLRNVAASAPVVFGQAASSGSTSPNDSRLGWPTSDEVEEARQWLVATGFGPSAERLCGLWDEFIVRGTNCMLDIATEGERDEEWETQLLRNLFGYVRPELVLAKEDSAQLRKDRVGLLVVSVTRLAEFCEEVVGRLKSLCAGGAAQQGKGNGGKDPPRGAQDKDPPITQAVHSPDFHSVNWFGTEYTFTPNQAACVKLLWEAWDQGTPEVGGDYLIETADIQSSSKRMDTVFREHPAWATMIVPGEKKGNYRLAKPGHNAPGKNLPARAKRRT